MRKFKLELEDSPITIEVAANDENRKMGLSGRDDIDSGMLFVFPYTGHHRMWMKNTNQNLDIIYLNEKGVITEIITGKKDDTTLLGDSKETRFVLELPHPMAKESDIEVGDIIPIPMELSVAEDEEEAPEASLLDEDGNPQMDIRGEERVFSQIKTKELIEMSRSANTDEELLALGKLISDEIEAQDNRESKYVDPGQTRYQYAKNGSKIKIEEDEKVEDSAEEYEDVDDNTHPVEEEMKQLLYSEEDEDKVALCIAFTIINCYLDNPDMEVKLDDDGLDSLYKKLHKLLLEKIEEKFNLIPDIIEMIKDFNNKERDSTLDEIPEDALIDYLNRKGYSLSKGE